MRGFCRILDRRKQGPSRALTNPLKLGMIRGREEPDARRHHTVPQKGERAVGTAYTPGLTVSAHALIRKTRRLPLKGEVLVEVGQPVEPQTRVARTELPGNVTMLRAADHLGVSPRELTGILCKQVGEPVQEGELLAETKGLWGRWFKATLLSPVTGTMEHINEVTGNMGLRHPPQPVEMNAYVRGTVAEILPEEGAIIVTRGALIQGIFGIGGEQQGPLQILSATREEVVGPERVDAECRGRIVVVGGPATFELMQQVQTQGAVGLVAAGVLDTDLQRLLGYDIGVAITGHEEVGFTLLLTEGFGEIIMAQRTFDLFLELDGQEASLSGATQIRAGVLRPEAIVARPELSDAELISDWEGSQELAEGTPIRLIREPFFGRLGTVAGLPPELQRIDSGASVRVLTATLEDGSQVVIPRANVEIVSG